MNIRVKFLRKQLNLIQEAFGARLGVTAAGISKIESGQRNLTEQMIILICKEFNINEKWLRYGEGEMYKEILSPEMGKLAKYYQLDDLDIRIISQYLLLDDKQRKVIKDYITKVSSIEINTDLMPEDNIIQKLLIDSGDSYSA